MILNVFTRIGVRLSVADAYQQLIALNPNDPYAKNKAAGSLGGAVNGGTIVLHRHGYYERIRWELFKYLLLEFAIAKKF